MAGFLRIRQALVLLLGAAALAQGDARLRLERISRGLEHLDPTDYVYDRVPEEITELAAFPRKQIEPLVGHPDPRVRALALGVLVLRGDPHSLPVMVAAAFDPGVAPPARQPNAVALPRPGFAAQPLWTLRPQSVGQVATAFVQAYMSAAGYHGGIEGHGDRPGFAEYWAERRGRAHCLSWFAVDLRRASQSSWPIAEERRPKIAALRSRIDALAEPYRHWILLALAAPWETGMAEPGTEVLASETDLVRAARALGQDLLLGLLRGEQVFPDDPDLHYGENSPFSCQRVVPFVLRHAAALLDPSCAGELRELGGRHLARQPVGASPTMLTARWFTAAADLDPAHAVSILRDALERFGGPPDFHSQDHRARLASALWRHGGAVELSRVQDWFFGEEPQRGAFGFGRHRFASELASPEQTGLLRAILRDPRLATLDWQTLRRLAEAANATAAAPVVPPDEIRALSHPLGEGHYHWEKESARALHPDATAALEATLTGWRSTLAAWAQLN